MSLAPCKLRNGSDAADIFRIVMILQIDIKLEALTRHKKLWKQVRTETDGKISCSDQEQAGDQPHDLIKMYLRVDMTWTGTREEERVSARKSLKSTPDSTSTTTRHSLQTHKSNSRRREAYNLAELCQRSQSRACHQIWQRRLRVEAVSSCPKRVHATSTTRTYGLASPFLASRVRKGREAASDPKPCCERDGSSMRHAGSMRGTRVRVTTGTEVCDVDRIGAWRGLMRGKSQIVRNGT